MELEDLDLVVPLASRIQRGPEKVGDRHSGNLGGVLKRQEDPGPRPLVGLQLQDVIALEEDFARGDLVSRVPRDHLRERALSRAVGTHQYVDLARLYGERQAAQDVDLLAGYASVQVTDVKQMLRHASDTLRL